MNEDFADFLRDQGRGVVGALLLGTPLLFTMETWWLGWRLPPAVILVFALGGLAVVLAAVRVAGFRANERQGPSSIGRWTRQFAEIVLQSLAAAFVVLYLFGILERADPLIVITRLGLIEVVPLGLGAALANTLLKGAMTGEAQRSPFPKDAAIFGVGALFFALPIAPTEEMELMAAHAGWGRLPAVIVVSLFLTYLTLYELEFRGQRGRTGGNGAILHVGETFMVYVLALIVSALLLAGYGHFTDTPMSVMVQMVVILGFPAALGGAAAQVVV